ncbi:MAG: GNAT family N-acetyltransferase [Hyphomicrobiales bacterium]
MTRIAIETKRMILAAATEELAEAELFDRARFARLLGAHVSPGWPPPLNDEASMAFLHKMLEGRPDVVGWANWYWLLRTDSGDGVPVAIGNGGFMGPPDEHGRVEIGYSVLETYQRRGLATEGVAALIAWAFEDPRVRGIVAQTRIDGRASQRVLEKTAFASAGAGREPGTLRFELPRPARATARGPRK